jgi:hypothetical protein
MFKKLKLLLVGVVCMFTIVLLQNDANAVSRSVYLMGCFTSDLTIELYGEGMGNYTRFPGQITLELKTRYATALCANPTKKKFPSRMGTPFFYEIDLSEEQPNDNWTVGDNGDFYTTFIFSNEDIFGSADCPEGACETNKWWDCARDEDGNPILLLTEFDLRIRLYSYLYSGEICNPLTDPNCQPFLDHDIYTRCTVNDDGHTWTCVEDCVDVNGDPLCYNVDQTWPEVPH